MGPTAFRASATASGAASCLNPAAARLRTARNLGESPGPALPPDRMRAPRALPPRRRLPAIRALRR
jgi:hypothetical protein